MAEKNQKTDGVEILLGEPKKAVLKLGWPMMLAMMVQTLYNIADGFWVAGLGADQLAAVGLFFPFFMTIMALGSGIGAGGSSAVSRKIGEENKEAADNAALHTVLFAVVIGAIITITVLPLLKEIFTGMAGDETVGEMATKYSRIIFSGSIILIFSFVANALLRGEGSAKKSMYGMVLGAGLNILLDLVFIYWLELGIVGAAWATFISRAISALLYFYWLYFHKDTYLTFRLKRFILSWPITKEILDVGIPSSLAHMSMSVTMLILNRIIVTIGGTDGVAVFTSGWRIFRIGIIPLMGIATSVISVTGAAFGACRKDKLNTAYSYSVKLGVLIEIGVYILIVIFADKLAYIFSYSSDAQHLSKDIVTFLRIQALTLPFVPLGMFTSSMFRGVRKGKFSLIVTIIRTVIFQILFVLLLGKVFNLGLIGVWWGIVAANILAGTLTFLWGKNYVKSLDLVGTNC